MNTIFRTTQFLLLLLSLQFFVKAQDFSLVENGRDVTILYSKEGPKLDSITAHLFAEDIERVTGHQPKVITDVAKATGSVIVIGNIESTLIQRFVSKQSSLYQKLQGKWECFGLKIIEKPINHISKALVIAGSDARGMAYGVFTLSEKIGVSPWYWWADVPVKQQKQLTITQSEFISEPPSVKYRGIFLNDEDWGLQPWAAKTFEPETGDIGPKTYAKIFELLLRLKANLIWPAMHPSTKAFFHYPGNVKTAEDYQIIISSSHAEPMLRNNVSEWNEKTMGHFNYITNKEHVYKYWEERVKESSGINAIYTLGMRGVHDSQMEGVLDPKEAVPLLEQIIADQRKLLSQYIAKDVTAIPQVFTIYKEVLDIYENGLKLPDDVTLVWPDDNYGYIQRLNNEKEQARTGGSGIYYHASYWGRPHDYIWLSSTHPALIREEMMKAYETGADRLWVLNVGDIKPLEYNITLFLDMAYDAKPFKDSKYVKNHLLNWAEDIFGKEDAQKIGSVLWQYYQLAFERRPEFMGWSRTEPTTQTSLTEYNHFCFGDEAQRRIDQYEMLEKEVKAIRARMDARRADAFYELVYYPVVGASLMNKKFLYRDKAVFYAKQGRLSALDYASLSKAAYDSIVAETAYYNQKLAGGKWNGMMSFAPRDLPVYQPPVIGNITINKKGVWAIAPEGVADTSQSTPNKEEWALPRFNRFHQQAYFIDLFLSEEQSVEWRASVSNPWIKVSQNKGVLVPEAGENQTRIWVQIDWDKVPKIERLEGTITFTGAGKQIVVNVSAWNPLQPELAGYKGFVENNGYVSVYAGDYNKKKGKGLDGWTIINDLGHTGTSLKSLLLNSTSGEISIDTAVIRKTAPYLAYDFFTFTAAPAEVSIFTLPTHPMNNEHSMRYAVSIDNGPLQVVDFKTFGRSEEWMQNVLRNSAVRKIKTPLLNAGTHTLNIYMIDPGVILDRMVIDLGGMSNAYSVIPETKIKM
jgi:hypothetical protein